MATRHVPHHVIEPAPDHANSDVDGLKNGPISTGIGTTRLPIDLSLEVQRSAYSRPFSINITEDARSRLIGTLARLLLQEPEKQVICGPKRRQALQLLQIVLRGALILAITRGSLLLGRHMVIRTDCTDCITGTTSLSRA